MGKKLAVVVLGNRNSGKSTTWEVLFGRKVKTGVHPRELYLNATEFVEVFLVNGSPEERNLDAEEIIKVNCDILLCSVQYTSHGLQTLKTLQQSGYHIYLQWLNPGYDDTQQYTDYLNIISSVLSYKNTLVTQRDGTISAYDRVEEIRSFIYDWSKREGFLKP